MNILLVDDEIDFLEATQKSLARRGYPVQGVTTCREALAVLESGWPDAMVLDVMLPDQNGIRFLEEIKGRWPGLAVLLLSGHASIPAGIRGIEAGAFDYCLKPVELDDLVEKILLAHRDSHPQASR